MHIDRTLPNGELSARFRVPLHYAKMEHALQRVTENPGDTEKKDAIVLPAMSFEMIDLKPAMERHVANRNRQAHTLPGDANNLRVMHAPVPYDFHFQLAIMVKNQNDGLKILESICPYFSNDYTATLELIPEMDFSVEVPLVLQGAAMNYDVPKEFQDRVTYIWVLDFVLQGYLFGPVKKWPLIKFSTVKMGVVDANGVVSNSVSITVQPGLTANGQPTYILSDSIPWQDIPIGSDYGIIISSNSAITGGPL